MIKEVVDLLGLRATDKITGVKGVVTSVCFDLCGCIQCALTPAATKDNETTTLAWFDVNRLDVSSDWVMAVPNFEALGSNPASHDSVAAENAPPR